MYYVYILLCISKKGKESRYTGMTNNLKRRFKEHETGRGAKYTKGKTIQLIYYEEFIHHKWAFMREKEIKRMSQKEKRKLIINV